MFYDKIGTYTTDYYILLFIKTSTWLLATRHYKLKTMNDIIYNIPIPTLDVTDKLCL